MDNKTAMQQLIEWINETPPQTRHACLYVKCIELLSTEKQQIISAHIEGQALSVQTFKEQSGMPMPETTLQIELARNEGNDINAEQYYSTTYKQ